MIYSTVQQGTKVQISHKREDKFYQHINVHNASYKIGEEIDSKPNKVSGDE